MYFLHTFFFFNDTATTEIYTLSLHDALPICLLNHRLEEAFHGFLNLVGNLVDDAVHADVDAFLLSQLRRKASDRKSTRLNSSHVRISYAVFCLKKKKRNPHVTGHV